MNPYHHALEIRRIPKSKTRLGIVPATLVAFSALAVFAMAAIQFHDAMLPEMTRSYGSGRVFRVFACMTATGLVVTTAGVLAYGSGMWLQHRVKRALFMTFIAPPALVSFGIFLMYNVQ